MTQRIILLIISLTSLCSIYGNEPAKNFTAKERNHLRVPTVGLFKERTSFSIVLDSLAKEPFSPPLVGAKVISGYGTKQRPGHTGVDLKSMENDSIRCVFDGVVRLSKSYYDYGNLIVIRHISGIETVYSHNAINLVKAGDVVTAGQVIGLVGRTGRASTDHLHLEFRIDGRHINPAWILDIKEESLRQGRLVCTQTANGVVIKKEKTNKEE